MRAYNLQDAFAAGRTLLALFLTGPGRPGFPEKVLGLTSLEQLELRRFHFKQLPEKIFHLSGLQRLCLDHNHLERLPREWRLPNLRILSLAGNELKEWQGKLPAGVEELDLSGNSIGRVTQLMDCFSSGRRLLLARNRLARLPKHFATACPKLELLDLSLNRLVVLPGDLTKLNYLSELRLNGNRLTVLPEDWSACHSLRRLTLNANRLTELPESLGRLPWLVFLDVSKNKLSRLPIGLFDGMRLQEANLNRNELTGLPDSISGLARLYRLDLSRNRIQVLPTFPASLEKLNLRHNGLLELPPSLGALSRLKVLDLSYNRLQTLPRELEGLKALEVLRLRGNPLITFPMVLLGMDQLKNLDGLGDLADRALLLRFLAICRKRAMPLRLRKLLYLMLQEEEALELGRPDLFEALNLPLEVLTSLARRALLSGGGKEPLSEQPRGICIAGRIHFRRAELGVRLSRQGILLSPEPDEGTTHVLLGQRPVWVPGYERRDLVFCSEKQLTDWLNLAEQNELVLRPSPGQLDRLRNLLLHPDPDNIVLAIRLLRGGGVPEALLTDMYYVWKTTSDKTVKRGLRDLLEMNFPESNRRAFSAKTSLHTGSSEQLARKIKQLTSGTQLNPDRLLELAEK